MNGYDNNENLYSSEDEDNFFTDNLSMDELILYSKLLRKTLRKLNHRFILSLDQVRDLNKKVRLGNLCRRCKETNCIPFILDDGT